MLKFDVDYKNKKEKTKSLTSTLTHKVLKSSSIILFFTFLSTPFAYFLRMLFSRTLSTADYGLFYAVLGFFTILATFNDLGFGYSVTYFIPKLLLKKDYQSCWKLYKYDQYIEIATSILISIVIYVFAAPLAKYYFKTPQAENIIYVFIIYFITSGFVSALNKFFTGLQKEHYYSSTGFLKAFFTLLLSFFFFFFGFGNILNYAWTWSISYVLIALIYDVLLHKNFKHFKTKVDWDKQLFDKMFRYAVPTLLNNSVFLLVAYTDVIFLTLFKNVETVGVLNVILPIVAIPSIFLSPINALFFPMVSKLIEESQLKVKLLIETILKLIPFIAFYFGLFVFIFPTMSVATLFGYKWAGLVETPLRIFAISYLFSALVSYLTTVVSGLGLVKEKLKISSQVAILNIILGGTLTYFYGITGLAWANLIVYFIALVLTLKIIKLKIKFEIPYYFYFKLSLWGGVIFSLVRLVDLRLHNFGEFISAGFIYTLVMIGFAMVIKISDGIVYQVIQESTTNFIKKYVQK